MSGDWRERAGNVMIERSCHLKRSCSSILRDAQQSFTIPIVQIGLGALTGDGAALQQIL
jgi:hypothetical protein